MLQLVAIISPINRGFHHASLRSLNPMDISKFSWPEFKHLVSVLSARSFFLSKLQTLAVILSRALVSPYRPILWVSFCNLEKTRVLSDGRNQLVLVNCCVSKRGASKGCFACTVSSWHQGSYHVLIRQFLRLRLPLSAANRSLEQCCIARSCTARNDTHFDTSRTRFVLKVSQSSVHASIVIWKAVVAQENSHADPFSRLNSVLSSPIRNDLHLQPAY